MSAREKRRACVNRSNTGPTTEAAPGGPADSTEKCSPAKVSRIALIRLTHSEITATPFASVSAGVVHDLRIGVESTRVRVVSPWWLDEFLVYAFARPDAWGRDRSVTRLIVCDNSTAGQFSGLNRA